MNRLDKLIKKSKFNCKIGTTSVDLTIKQLKAKHFILRHKKRKRDKRVAKYQTIEKNFNKHNNLKKIIHRQAYDLLKSFMTNQKVLMKKYKPMDVGMTTLSVVGQYLNTAKPAEAYMIKKHLANKIKSLSRKIKNK